VSKSAAGPRKKVRRKAAAAELKLYQQSDASAAAEYIQQPAGVDNVADAQVHFAVLWH
jgi:hypothetical protein